MPQVVLHNGNIQAGYASMDNCAVLVEDGRIGDVFSERRFEQKRFDDSQGEPSIEGMRKLRFCAMFQCS